MCDYELLLISFDKIGIEVLEQGQITPDGIDRKLVIEECPFEIPPIRNLLCEFVFDSLGKFKHISFS